MATVLVVDDDEMTLNLIKSVLLMEEDEFQVFLARNGRKGLEKFIYVPVEFDLIITDFNMPEMNGNEMVQEIRNSGHQTPVIFMSGNKSNFQGLADLGNVGFIEKPLQLVDLKEKIQKFLVK